MSSIEPKRIVTIQIAPYQVAKNGGGQSRFQFFDIFGDQEDRSSGH